MHFEVGDRVRIVHDDENDSTYAYVLVGSTGCIKERRGEDIYKIDLDNIVVREDYDIKSTGIESLEKFIEYAAYGEKHLELTSTEAPSCIESKEFDSIFE